MPRLTNAQKERLDLVQEECAEIIQSVSKIRRFGYNSKSPLKPDGPTNKEHLEIEIGGLCAILDLLVQAGEISEDNCEAAQILKSDNIGMYTKYQEVKEID